MNLTREIIENLFLQLVDRVDERTILMPDIYGRIGTPFKDLDGVTFARNKDDSVEHVLKYVVDQDAIHIEHHNKEITDEQSTDTSTAEETATE